jgi:tryptophan-rich sensory protein
MRSLVHGRFTPVLAAFGAAILVAALGRSATRLDRWYFALTVPSWKPPDWLFGPAWTLLYTLAALAAIDGWSRSEGFPALRKRMLVGFGVNALLGILWSVLFFDFRRPDWALAEVGVFWVSVLALILVMARPAPRASWLLAPYLAWVTFAAALNLAIVNLNPSF